jgi:hypothetical protein
VPVDFRHSSGEPHVNYLAPSREPSFFNPPREGGAWINHYHTRSAEEFLRSRARGTGDQPLGTNVLGGFVLQAFLAQHSRSDLVRDDRILYCGRAFEDHYQELIAIPGIAEIVSNIERNARDRVTELKANLSDRAASGDGEQGVAEFLALLGGAD